MDIEEFFLEKIQNYNILPRRYGLKNGLFHIFGPPKSGKTSIALNFAKNFKKPIYIDYNDFRIEKEKIKPILLKLYLEKKIDILIIDNFTPDFAFPKVNNIILITQNKISNILKNFTSKPIFALNFEEYISFDKKNLSIKTLFNHFLKDGNLPEIQNLNEYQKVSKKQEMLSYILKQNLNFFILLINFQSNKITPNQIYTQAKKSLKISKDKTYELINFFQDNQIIYLIPHLNTQTKPKKIFFYDFSIPYSLSLNKTFQAIFENMVFLELYIQNTSLYYNEECNLIDSNLNAYITYPFPTIDFIEQKIKQLQIKYNKIFFITINFESYGKIQFQEWQALSFIDFALKDFI